VRTLMYRNPRLAVLTICLILVAGLSGYLLLPRLEDPVLNNRFGIIKTRFPGATPTRVESLVTEQIEESLREIEEIKVVESTSSSGASMIQIELRDEVTQVDAVWSRVRDKLDAVGPKLPLGAEKPRFEELETRAYAMIVGLSWTHPGEPNGAILRRRAKELADVLQTIPGTEKVELYGEPTEEILVEIDPSRLASVGLTAGDLSRQLMHSDAKVAAGQLHTRRNGLLLEVANDLDTLERIRNTPIRYGDGSDFVRLSDVAEVRKGTAEPADEAAIINGRPGVALAVYVLADRRIDLWADSAKTVLRKHKSGLPRGVELDVVFDQSRYTQDRLSELMLNLGLGAVAVSCVVFLLMGWRSAVLMAVALPLSVLMVFAGMQILSIPIHQMSVMGIIIALGLLIDNAIIMVDEVTRELRAGKPVLEAISGSVKKLAVPLLGSTLTTVLAFMPIALMIGPAGEFVDALALSVILALFSSYFLALTIVPALTAFLRRAENNTRVPSLFSSGIDHATLRRGYRASLRAVFSRPVLGLVIGLVLPVAGFLGAMSLQEQFFPPSERDQFHIEIELPAQASIAETRAATQRAERLLRKRRKVQAVHWFLGRSAPSFFYNLMNTRQYASHYAQGMVQLNSRDDPQQLIRNLQSELSRELPGARVLVRQLGQGPPFPAPIEFRIYGPDTEELRRLGRRARLELSRVPHVVGTRAELNESVPKLGLTISEEEAQLAGMSNTDIARQLDATLQGAVGGAVLEQTENLPVRVRLADRRMNAILSMQLLSDGNSNAAGSRSPTGAAASALSADRHVPLNALAEVNLVSEHAAIRRRNGRRMNTIQGYVTAGVLTADVLDAYRARLQPMVDELPPGYSVEFGGETSRRNDAIGNLMNSAGVLIVLMVATLVLSFSSFRMAGIIAVVGALSVGLGLLALKLFDYPFGFMAILGTMGLVGIAINDSIVVLAAIRNHPDARRGDPVAVENVVAAETRHVLATTLTTIAGFTPLLASGGTFWPPLAVAIAGGVTGATLLALYFVPSAHLLLIGRRKQPAPETDPLAMREEMLQDGISPPPRSEQRSTEVLAGSP